MIKRITTAFVTLCLAFAGVIVSSSPASAVLSARECRNFDTPNSRRLSVCARVWYTDDRRISRGVVEMHTYILVNGYPVADAPAKTITLNAARYEFTHVVPLKYGNNYGPGPNYCRVNGPSGNLACSVPNTSRVAFYSGQRDGLIGPGSGSVGSNCVDVVSWRDDQNNPWVTGTVGGAYLFCFVFIN